MRGYTTAARIERKAAVQRAELDRTSHQVIVAARRALIDTIERFPTPGLDPLALRMVAISGLFADSVACMAGTRQAPQLVALINQQLACVGPALTPLLRNWKMNATAFPQRCGRGTDAVPAVPPAGPPTLRTRVRKRGSNGDNRIDATPRFASG